MVRTALVEWSFDEKLSSESEQVDGGVFVNIPLSNHLVQVLRNHKNRWALSQSCEKRVVIENWQ